MMKRKVNLIYYLVLLVLGGCSGNQSGNKNVVSFTNDFEGQKGWCTLDNLYEGMGHSGRFSTIASSTSPYSSIFRIKFKDIIKSPVTYLRFSVWCYAESLPADGQLVVSVDGDTAKSIIWHNWKLSEFVSEPNKWFEVNGELNLLEKGANKPENTFVFYLMNNGKATLLGDDFHFEFTKK